MCDRGVLRLTRLSGLVNDRPASGSTARSFLAAVSTIVALAYGPTVYAQAEPESKKSLAEIVVTGSRRATTSPTDTPAPVDLIGADQLTEQAGTDTTDLLRNLIPSLNVNANPLSGTSTTVRPVSMRGLSPDHVLLLVNGKRRHRAADIATFSGGISDGSQGPDLASIPATALKQVQVLRDGASAQYGADAIAGVINFILDDSTDGGRIGVKAGRTDAGDGSNYELQGAYGMPLGGSGFARFTVEYGSSGATTRSVESSAQAALIASGNTHVPDPPRWGTPKVSDNLRVFVNLASPATDNSTLYAFGGYAQRKTESDFFYRNPTARGGVFTTSDNGGAYLVGDMTPNDGINCDGGIDFGGTGKVNNPILVGAPGSLARLAAATSNPNCFSFVNVFPGGYKPLFGSALTDISGTVGLRGKMPAGLTYDLSVGAGRNELTFNVKNSPNPSLGSLSPLVFESSGSRIQLERFVNFDAVYPVTVPGLASPLNVASGVEWHSEEFQVVTGQPESFATGVLATQGFIATQEAYPGYTPTAAGLFDRKNAAVYVDLDADITAKLRIAAAGRYEDFDDVGGQVTYKLSGMYHLTNAVAIRSTFATGFHAPSPGQAHFTALTTEINAQGNLIDTGVIPASSPVAKVVGGQPLRPEQSDSLSVGLVLQSEHVTATVDAYDIRMKHRLTQSASYTLTDAQRAELKAEGFAAAAGIGNFRFFTNNFASTTKGVDIEASTPIRAIQRGTTYMRLAANYTATDVTSFHPNDPNEILSQARVTQLEQNLPKWRGSMSIDHSEGNWRATLRGNFYGAFTELHLNAPGLRINAAARGTIDVEGAYRVTPSLEISVGLENVLNKYPTVNPWGFIVGSKYPTTSPYGINGGMYFVQAVLKM